MTNGLGMISSSRNSPDVYTILHLSGICTLCCGEEVTQEWLTASALSSGVDSPKCHSTSRLIALCRKFNFDGTQPIDNKEIDIIECVNNEIDKKVKYNAFSSSGASTRTRSEVQEEQAERYPLT
jgi:hypothetical protein